MLVKQDVQGKEKEGLLQYSLNNVCFTWKHMFYATNNSTYISNSNDALFLYVYNIGHLHLFVIFTY